MTMRRSVLAAGMTMLAVAAAAAPGAMAQDSKPLKVVAAYSSVIEEPWDGVINAALNAAADAGKITHKYQDNIGYDGGMELALREIAESDQPDIIFGDSFGNEEAVRKVAADYPEIPFVFGSGGGPADPNFSVFDNWIHEPAYLAGWLAGGLTKSNTIGVVAGYPVPEVNRLANAFIQGAQAKNKDVKVLVTFINSWFDPATAKEAALAQIGAGADVLYAERAGVIEAAKEKNVLAIGNMSDEQAEAPQNVITSVTWNMTPTVDYVIDQVSKGAYTSQDLKDFSMMAKGGSALAPINSAVVDALPATCTAADGTTSACTGKELTAEVDAAAANIKSGLLRVDINEAEPAGSTTQPTASPAAS
jgi:basic membrane protein A and related proteins